MARAFVALGGNVEPALRLAQAARLLRAEFPGITFSPCYRNPAVGFAGADFLNAVAGFDTPLDPAALVAVLHGIEEQCGRSRADSKWGPRAMDIDLLLHGSTVGEGPGYRLPRPDLALRHYMLRPLADLAPELVLPGVGRRVDELWGELARTPHAMEPEALDLNRC
jgi:2-amino-4-hydroxy-6-hydroxymethyldihydropteridine diphosphokinase